MSYSTWLQTMPAFGELWLSICLCSGELCRYKHSQARVPGAWFTSNTLMFLLNPPDSKIDSACTESIVPSVPSEGPIWAQDRTACVNSVDSLLYILGQRLCHPESTGESGRPKDTVTHSSSSHTIRSHFRSWGPSNKDDTYLQPLWVL